MREDPETKVAMWLDGRPTSSLFITAITEAEILRGIAVLPEGRRKRGLAAAAEYAFDVLLERRILPFDSAAAQAYAAIVAERLAAGRPISQSDCQIAAIARARGMAVATGNVGGFMGCGIDVINPWTDG